MLSVFLFLVPTVTFCCFNILMVPCTKLKLRSEIALSLMLLVTIEEFLLGIIEHCVIVITQKCHLYETLYETNLHYYDSTNAKCVVKLIMKKNNSKTWIINFLLVYVLWFNLPE